MLLRIIPLAFRYVPDVDLNLNNHSSLQVRVDFNRPFYGQAVDSLITYTNECYNFACRNNNKIYAKTFPILQSSGTGKTKLAVQLSSQRPKKRAQAPSRSRFAKSHFDPKKDANQETTTGYLTEHATEHQEGITSDMANASAKDQEPVRYAQYASAKYICHDLRRLEALLPKSLNQKHFFFLCLDEVAGFQALLPIFPVKASLRLDDADTGQLVLPPFIYLPFDVAFVPKKDNYKQRLLDGRLTHDHLVDLIRLFGRPLWSTGLYSDLWKPDLNPSLYRPNLCNILLKLLPERINDSEKWSEPDAYNHHACVFSLLGQCLPLFFVGHQNTRISTSVPERQPNKTSSRIICPSPPPRSFEATLLISVEKCIERWSTAIEVLADTHRSAGIMLGEEGEECIRLLCCLAADLVAAAAVESTLQHPSPGTLFSQQFNLFVAQSKYVCLKDWLECLVGPQSLRQDLCSWSAEYYINFTHWMRLGGTLQPGHLDPMLLAEHWMRQTAFYGQLGQPQWDLVIPIYHSPGHAPRGDEPIDPNRFSYVALQVKNRNGDGEFTKFFEPCHWLCTSSIDDEFMSSSPMTTMETCLETVSRLARSCRGH
ncbi:uncharacterized protein UTRI_10068 [Ustilago trichophora]|uniref:Uncharacterized protein n=1 Tax=Ustilago trichophora TaxID=86804 RepID=A0A5C3DX12_9BASI|nr:uncharacterized protein UTRI_10068 [Ustilago trichophora]